MIIIDLVIILCRAKEFYLVLAISNLNQVIILEHVIVTIKYQPGTYVTLPYKGKLNHSVVIEILSFSHKNLLLYIKGYK